MNKGWHVKLFAVWRKIQYEYRWNGYFHYTRQLFCVSVLFQTFSVYSSTLTNVCADVLAYTGLKSFQQIASKRNWFPLILALEQVFQIIIHFHSNNHIQRDCIDLMNWKRFVLRIKQQCNNGIIYIALNQW